MTAGAFGIGLGSLRRMLILGRRQNPSSGLGRLSKWRSLTGRTSRRIGRHSIDLFRQVDTVITGIVASSSTAVRDCNWNGSLGLVWRGHSNIGWRLGLWRFPVTLGHINGIGIIPIHQGTVERLLVVILVQKVGHHSKNIFVAGRGTGLEGSMRGRIDRSGGTLAEASWRNGSMLLSGWRIGFVAKLLLRLNR